ncbi:MAG: hypothetical protein EOP02_10265 [Proteobacteria bacterium]|nr:MAG: hypothetical protein EOP02_10265 [Pseudomonadota bacterium]
MATALLSSPVLAKEARWPEGIYSSVRMSEQSGDLGGLEVLFYERDGRTMVEYVLCEGWCNSSFQAEVRREGDSFIFEHHEVVEQADGTISRDYVRFVLRQSDQHLLATGWMGENSFDAGKMRRISKPYGLGVAKKRNSPSDL